MLGFAMMFGLLFGYIIFRFLVDSLVDFGVLVVVDEVELFSSSLLDLTVAASQNHILSQKN